MDEPDTAPPAWTLADFFHTPPSYRSGDFLLLPVDLRQPRLVPEPGRLSTTQALRLGAAQNLP